MDEVAGPARELADGIEAALPRWVERCVDTRYRAWNGPPPAEVADAARAAGVVAGAETGPRVRALLEADIDEQWTTPLALVREAVAFPTKVLREAGVPEVERDPIDVSLLPDDVYRLAPAAFADLDPGLAEAGLVWGAAKAWVHRRRHAS
jgi:hypothetical protein